MIAPSYWVDPKSGNDYLLTVQYREGQVKTLDDLHSIPIRSSTEVNSTRLDAVSSLRHIHAPTEVDHYQLRRVIDVFVAPSGEDLGKLASSIEEIISATPLPEGVRIDLRGMVQGMRVSFRSFGLGLILAVVLVYLILVAQFKSFIDPLLILLAVPTGLTGVLIILCGDRHNAECDVADGDRHGRWHCGVEQHFDRGMIGRLRADGKGLNEAIALASRVRLRPEPITSLATLIGLIPMAAKFGTGSEAYAPLALAIIGGLTVSVFLTIFIVPAAYLLVYRRESARLLCELPEAPALQ